MSRIYISGQITGLDYKVAYDYFEQTENFIRDNGHIPVNPMKLNPPIEEASWLDYMRKDIAALATCDAIMMLENWHNSKGAKVEHDLAVGLGLKIHYMGKEPEPGISPEQAKHLKAKYDTLVDHVRKMRGHQKEYFRYRASSDLTLSKQWEKKVDDLLIEEVKSAKQKQTTIF